MKITYSQITLDAHELVRNGYRCWRLALESLKFIRGKFSLETPQVPDRA